MKHVTSIVWIPYTSPEEYKYLSGLAFEWRKKWVEHFEFSFVDCIYHPDGRLRNNRSPTLKVIVIKSTKESFKDLPMGITHIIIDSFEPVWGLKAYIRDLSYGIKGKIVHGTKHFLPNQAVYPHKIYSGDGYERSFVTGRQKESNRFISIMMPVIKMEKWSIEKLSNPIILFRMQEGAGWNGSTGGSHQAAQLEAINYANFMNERILRHQSEDKI